MSIIQLFSSMSAEQAASVFREDLNSFVRAELERAFNEALDGEIEEGMGRGVRFEVVETVSEAGFVAFGKGRFHVSLLRIPEGDAEIDLHVQRGGIASENLMLEAASQGLESNTIRRIPRRSSWRRFTKTTTAMRGRLGSCSK